MEDIGHISSRVMWIDCVWNETPNCICSNRRRFYKELSGICVAEKKRQLVICGDMNATAEYWMSFVGGMNCTHLNANDNGERLANFLTSF